MGKKNPKFIADKNMQYKVARIIIKTERKQKKKGRSMFSLLPYLLTLQLFKLTSNFSWCQNGLKINKQINSNFHTNEGGVAIPLHIKVICYSGNRALKVLSSWN